MNSMIFLHLHSFIGHCHYIELPKNSVAGALPVCTLTSERSDAGSDIRAGDDKGSGMWEIEV